MKNKGSKQIGNSDQSWYLQNAEQKVIQLNKITALRLPEKNFRFEVFLTEGILKV